MPSNILIRVDGGVQTGLGHLVRCLALADMLEEKFTISFVCIDLPKAYSEQLKLREICVKRIEEENEIFEIIKGNEIVVTDGYQFDSTYIDSLKNKTTVVSIQDVIIINSGDMVINHLPQSSDSYSEVLALTGPEYALLRKEFLSTPVASVDSKDFFISLGGTLNFPILNKLVKLINDFFPETTIHIVTTDVNAGNIRGTNYFLYTDVSPEQMVNLLDMSRLCFITSGMISYEALARRRHCIVGGLNEGQVVVGEKFRSLGLVEYIGYWEDFDASKLKKAINLESISPTRISNIFDGKSGERLLKKFLEL